MATIGYNVNLVTQDLLKHFEDVHLQKMGGHQDDQDRRIQQMQDIDHLRNEINAQRTQKDKKGKSLEKVDCNTEPLIALVDQIREIDPTLIPEHTYSWETKEEIDALFDNLGNKVKLQSLEIHQNQLLVEMCFHIWNQVTQSFSKMEETQRKQMELIIGKTGK